MVAAVGGGEGKAALCSAFLGDDAVVIVEDFVDCYEDGEGGRGGGDAGCGIEEFGAVLAWFGGLVLDTSEGQSVGV